MSHREHFLLIKQSGFNAEGEHLSAYESAKALLDAGMWPLWEKTRCQHMVQPNHKVLVCFAGEEAEAKNVIASASISSIDTWSELKHKEKWGVAMMGGMRSISSIDFEELKKAS